MLVFVNRISSQLNEITPSTQHNDLSYALRTTMIIGAHEELACHELLAVKLPELTLYPMDKFKEHIQRLYNDDDGTMWTSNEFDYVLELFDIKAMDQLSRPAYSVLMMLMTGILSLPYVHSYLLINV